MADMTTAEQIAFLKNMIATNVLESRQADGKLVRFGDIEEIKARIAFLRTDSDDPAVRNATRTTFATFSTR